MAKKFITLRHFLIKYLLFKPLYRLDNVISGKYVNGLYKRPDWQKPSRYKWLGKFTYYLAVKMSF